MRAPKYLTKSRYVMALSCPTKLYYSANNRYANQKIDDPFLQALANGGHQVGALAKAYFPEGHDITTLEYDDALAETQRLLEKENVTIFEPAIHFGNFFIRIDILVKTGNHFDLYEVKAKSIDPLQHSTFFSTRGATKGQLKADWKPYLHDVAFQHFILSKEYPDSTINSHLKVINKQAVCETDGLYQKIQVKRLENNKGLEVTTNLSQVDLENKLLSDIAVNDVVEHIHTQVDAYGSHYEDKLNQLSDCFVNNHKVSPVIGKHCKTCEFTCTDDDAKNGKLSGFKECWSEILDWSDTDFLEDNILSVWNYKNTDELIKEQRIKFSELAEADIGIKKDSKPGLSQTERQWLQIEKNRSNDDSVYLDRDAMKAEMATWTFPLHFIDFETLQSPISMFKGLRPNETIAFQFSHHIVYEDGGVEHAGEFLHSEKDVFPNFEFIRALKRQLDTDNGSIFCYANHENAVLNTIYGQLRANANEIEDSDALCDFIQQITHSGNKSKESWQGKRDMIDMQKLVVRYYYHAAMKGSNSIKDVLPAVLNSSAYIQEKYSNPIYGVERGIKSSNFPSWTWVVKDKNGVKDPYKLLPKLFTDISDDELRQLEEEDLANGGAAMTAYARMQLDTTTDQEIEGYRKGLLKYCELDTLAMVMIYEAWRELVFQ